MDVQILGEGTIKPRNRPVRDRSKPYKRKPHQNANYRLPFVGWDSEGYTDDKGVHHPMLWGCSSGEYIKGQSLDGFAMFDLMLDVAAKRKAIHVIFSGGYDVVMMIRNYPTLVADRILHGRVTWWGGYRHEYFKGKFLKLSDGKRSIILYDVFTFFSTSFVRACREYLGDNPDFDRIEQTKLLRDSFTEESLEELVIPYWKQELVYLVELCTILRTRLLDAGIRNGQWHGPGAVAGAVLKQRGIKAHMSESPERVTEASRYAYFGGRFEQFQIGYREGDIYQYDIRSAYPHAIRRLPSLSSIKWIPKQRRKASFDSFGIYRIRYQGNPNQSLTMPGPLPWRSQNGNIYYPHDISEGWYWGIELQATQRHNTGTITVLEAWEPSELSTNRPFTWVAEMYDERARMKREGNPTQLALKLAMNSLYGKLAQSKGASFDEETSRWKIPTYHQLEWAGWITASCRSMLWDAIQLAGNSIIAVETDAIYCTKKLPLPCSPNLGDWEEEVAEAIMYVQSGVYFKKSNGSWKLKSRGFEPRNHTFEAWYSVMARLPMESDATVSLKLRRFGSVPSSQHWATWFEMVRTSQILQASSKRIHNPVECVWCDRGHSMTEFMHTLIVPQYAIDADVVPSAPHKLPWIDTEAIGYEDEWVISEAGMEEFMGIV